VFKREREKKMSEGAKRKKQEHDSVIQKDPLVARQGFIWGHDPDG